MTHQRTLTAMHWGIYEAELRDGEAVALRPFSPTPALADRAARAEPRPRTDAHPPPGHPPGLARAPPWPAATRGAEPFVEVPWDEALDLVAGELHA